VTITDHGITVTIKYGKAYDDTWAVFKGQTANQVRDDILSYFGFDYTEMSLHELVLNMTQVAHGGSTVTRVLDAVAVPEVTNVHVANVGNPWAGLSDDPTEESPAQQEEEKPFAYIYELFEKAQSPTELQRIWAQHQAAFSDENVIAAYKARGKELS
jgi:hypothetical protein